MLALVDLDQVVEAEEAAQERPVPHQVVERAEEHGGGRGAVELGAGRDDDRRPAVVDLDALERPVGDERVDVRPDRARAAVEAAVLGDPGLGQRAAALRRRGARSRAGTPPALGAGASSAACGITRSGRS